MLSVSAALAAMAAANYRTLATQITMDPNRTGDPEALDLTDFFSDWQIDRQLNTDVPAAARMVVGYVAGEFTGTGVGAQALGVHVIPGKQWSPYAAGSIFFGKDPLNTPMRVQAGMPGELIPRFTGYLRSISTQAGEVAIDALDKNSQLLGQTVIPMLGNSYLDETVSPRRGTRPNLSGNSIMDFTLRQNGIYMTPPPRSGCFLSVPGHGTLHAEPGLGTSLYDGTPSNLKTGCYEQHTGTTPTFDGTMVSYDHIGAFGGGPFGDNGFSGITGSSVPACALTAPSDYIATYGATTTVLWSDVFATNKAVTVEAWVFVPSTPPQGLASNAPLWGIRFAQDPRPTSADTYHLAAVGLLANGAPYASVGSTFATATGSASTSKGWLYFQATLKFGLSSTSVQWRVNNQSLQTATISAVPAIGFFGQGAGFYIQLSCNRASTSSSWITGERTSFEALQVTTESNPASNFTFEPTAFLDYSLNPLVVSPFSATGRDTVQLLQDITAAEFGLSYFDEIGNFYFFNRARWGRSPGNSSRLTVTSENQLEQLAVTSNTDGIINDVQINYTPWSIGLYQQLYNLGKLIGVHSGQTFTYWVTLTDPAVALDTGGGAHGFDGALPPLPAGTVTHSGYRASFAPDGNGTSDPPTNVDVFITQIDEQRVKFTIVNNENRPIYIVSGSDQAASSKGTPFIFLFGRPVTQATEDNSDGQGDNTTIATSTDAVSIAKYGDRVYSSQQNDWLQSTIVANQVSASLLAQLKDPHPLIENVQIKAHPGLQLGDRITLQDNAGTQLNTSSSTIGTVIVGMTESFSVDTGDGGGGYGQSLTLRLLDMSKAIT